MLKNAIKSAHYLSVLLPVCWLLWAWHRGGAIALALHFPLAAAGFLMLNNAFTMPLSHDWLDVSVWILLPPAVASWLIAPWLWHRLVK